MTTDTLPKWTFGERLAKAREHAGMSVEDMAAALGVSPNTIHNYEAQRTTPKLAMVKQWAMSSGVPVWWITEETPTSACLTVDEIWGQLVLVPDDLSSLGERLRRVV